MTVYAVGDVQGCCSALRRLLDKVHFDSAADTLWLCGDMVNRGPQSLATIELVRELGGNAVCVLGNHDLTLLAVAEGCIKPRRKDTFTDILRAAERSDHIEWLRHRPLLHHDEATGFTMVHAGLAPQWNLPRARACAAEVESALRGGKYRKFLRAMYGNTPDRWRNKLKGMARLRCITNIMTRIRFCSADGTLALEQTGPPGSQPKGFMPWYKVPGRRNAKLNIVFGHWAALGLYNKRGVYGIDSGCVWGGRLTALALTTDSPPRTYQVECDSGKSVAS